MTTTREFQAAEMPLRPAGRLRDYVAMARPDHWVKQVFVVPGIILAGLLRPPLLGQSLTSILLGLLSVSAIASANYVLNEWLDADSDSFDLRKAGRPAVQKQLVPGIVALEYVGLAIAGLALAALVSKLSVVISILLLASGLAYNVSPIRTKDVALLDVLTESFNNPLRLTLGWAMVDPSSLPPGSLVLAYWMGGGFLMALKRLAEYRSARSDGRIELLERYRRSFRRYSEESLLLSSFLYALLAAFFLAVFLVKYRIEYLVSLPLFAALFTSYLRIALKPESSAQAPEHLFRERSLVFLLAALTGTLAFLTWFDIPALEHLSAPYFIEVLGR